MASKSLPPVNLKWKVLITLSNGGRIHGTRRIAGDVFEAPESAMHQQELEGLVERLAPSIMPEFVPQHEADPGQH